MADMYGGELFKRRVEACQGALRERDADAVICFPGSNMTYLSGFSEEPMERHLLLFVTRSETALLAPELYAEQLAAESWVEDRRTWADGDNLRELIEEITTGLGIGGGGGGSRGHGGSGESGFVHKVIFPADFFNAKTNVRDSAAETHAERTK